MGIGDAVKSFVEKRRGTQLTKLCKEHLLECSSASKRWMTDEDDLERAEPLPSTLPKVFTALADALE